MLTPHRSVAILIFPAIAYLGAACERTDTPTEARLMASLAGPARLLVDDDLVQCPTAQYMSIQAAVNDAQPGDHIDVCPGTYTEEVTISGAVKNNIALRSVQRWQAVIKAPALMLGPTKAIVRVNGAHGVTILAFTITGPSNTLVYGVRVDDDGSADILGNHITQISDDPLSGDQSGVAVQVGRWIEGTTGSARIVGNVIDNYQKNGVTVDNEGSHADVAHNRVFGIGPTTITAQNGIQASRGATAEIRHNFVSGNVYSPGTVASTGVLLYGSGAAVTEHNTLNSNDVGAYMFDFVFENASCGTAAGSTTAYNRARASTFDGIIVSGFSPCLATDVHVAHNKSDQNRGPGIGVYDAKQSAFDNNRAEGNQDSGILLGDVSDLSVANNNTVGDNNVRNNGSGDNDMTDGIRINAVSAGNTVHDNHLRDNVTHDCYDGGTGNMWVNNHGETSQPPGLCGRDDNDADFETSTVYGWDAAYPWYDAFDVAADFDWAAAYATIDTESLLQLVPAVRTGGIRRSRPSPNQ